MNTLVFPHLHIAARSEQLLLTFFYAEIIPQMSIHDVF